MCAIGDVDLRRKLLVRDIIVIIITIKHFRYVVVCPEIRYSVGLCIRMIPPGSVVGHKIDDHFHAGIMHSFRKSFKFLHTPFHINCKTRIYIIVVLDSIRRSSLTFDNARKITDNAIRGKIRFCGILDNTCKPDAVRAKITYGIQKTGCVISHLSASVLSQCAVGHTSGSLICQQTR